MDTIAKYRLGPEKLEKIQAENKEKIERLQSKYLKQPYKLYDITDGERLLTNRTVPHHILE